MGSRSGGGRGGGGGKFRNQPFNRAATVEPYTFKSQNPRLATATYDCSKNANAARFHDVTGEIERYIQTEWAKHGSVVADSIRRRKLVEIFPPQAPKKEDFVNTVETTIKSEDGPDRKTSQEEHDESGYEFAKIEWSCLAKSVVYERKIIKDGNTRLFGVLINQCSPAMRNRLKGTKGYSDAHDAQDGIVLLDMIRMQMCGVQTHVQPTCGFATALLKICTFYQKEDVSNDTYREHFDGFIEVLESLGSRGLPTLDALIHDKLHEHDLTWDDSSDEVIAEAKAEVREEVTTMFMLLQADRYRFSRLKGDLADDFLFGRDNYPKNREDLLCIMNEFKGGRAQPAQPKLARVAEPEDVAFIQKQEQEPEAPPAGEKKTNRAGQSKCYNCGKDDGHWEDECPDLSAAERAKLKDDRAQRHKKKDGSQHCQLHSALPKPGGLGNCGAVGEGGVLNKVTSAVKWGLSLLQSGTGGDPVGHEFPRRSKKVHLDSCSTYNSICDPELLDNIRDADVPMRGHCNAGVKVISKVGDFGGVESWLDETGIANILSIPVLKKLGYHITYDSHDNYYQVSKDGVSFRFNEGDDGLPYINAGEEGLIFVQTVRQQYEGFTKKQVEKAILARKATGLLGYPTERDMEALVSNNLDNVPFTVTDIRNAKTIFGPDLAGVRGKTVRESPKHVVTDVVAIPRDFMKLHKFVTLVADVMFVNSVPFLVTSSRGIKFVTAGGRDRE